MTTFAVLLSTFLWPIAPAPRESPVHLGVPAACVRREAARLIEGGRASWYGIESTASGMSMAGLTCAHRFLRFGTRVLVVNQAKPYREAILLVVDRTGPKMIRMHPPRVIDLSPAARDAIMPGQGLCDVVLYQARSEP